MGYYTVRIRKVTDGGDCRLHNRVGFQQMKATRQRKPQIAQGLRISRGVRIFTYKTGRSKRMGENCMTSVMMLTVHRVKMKKVHKGKSVPLQAWSGPEGSRKLRFPDFMTTAHGDGKFVSHTNRPHLPPVNPPGTHFC